jgi:glycosyltransferase involved in cell wall biosynthesis
VYERNGNGPPPSVSVIVAVYNRAQFLTETVKSALHQSIRSLEVLIVNDGSTDHSGTIAQQLEKSDSRVRLINLQCNCGPSYARNIALDAARGDFIAILDADDLCMPDRFEKQASFLQQTGIDLCGSWFVEFGRGPARQVRWPHAEASLQAAMLFQSTICHPTVMARRHVFEHHRYKPEMRLAEDYDFFSRVMTNFRLGNVPEALIRYRRHADQATMLHRAAMESATREIRLAILAARGIDASDDEKRLHNLIRAPTSIKSESDLAGIESWLTKLIRLHEDAEARRIIASQWIRACVRASPLGTTMWRKYRQSRLRQLACTSAIEDIDMAVMAVSRLDYGSRAFEVLRRLGLSA